MAQVMKRRSLVNSGTRRRRRSNASSSGRKKRMTAKQIKYFGTARQKAALRASGSRKRRRNAGAGSVRKSKKRLSRAPVGLYKVRAHTTKFKRRLKRRRKNIGAIYSIGLAGLASGNPGTRKRRKKVVVKRRKRSLKGASGTMARRRRARRTNAGTRKRVYRRRRRAVAVVRRRRRRNTGVSVYRRRRRSNRRSYSVRRRRNVGGVVGSTTGIFKNALGVIGGAVATRYATQLALGGKNTGAIGYLGNAIAALVLGWGVKKFLKSPQLGAMVTVGGFTGLALRLLTDLTPIGQYVNLSLNGAGKAGDIGIGMITDSTFFVPTVFQPGSMNVAQIPNQVTQMIAAGSRNNGGGVGSYRRRRMAA